MNRNDWFLVAALSVVPNSAAAAALAYLLPQDWLIVLGVMSGWVSAIGVFAAVMMSGAQSRKQSERTRACDHEDFVQAVNLIIGKILIAGDDIARRIKGGRKQQIGVPDPLAQLEILYAALDEVPLYQLRDWTLNSLAIDIKARLWEALTILREHLQLKGMVANLPDAPPALPDVLDRMGDDAKKFMEAYKTGDWQ